MVYVLDVEEDAQVIVLRHARLLFNTEEQKVEVKVEGVSEVPASTPGPFIPFTGEDTDWCEAPGYERCDLGFHCSREKDHSGPHARHAFGSFRDGFSGPIIHRWDNNGNTIKEGE